MSPFDSVIMECGLFLMYNLFFIGELQQVVLSHGEFAQFAHP